MFDTMKIAKKIREARMAKNMTQMNLADAMGVSYQAVSNWEREFHARYLQAGGPVQRAGSDRQ